MKTKAILMSGLGIIIGMNADLQADPINARARLKTVPASQNSDKNTSVRERLALRKAEQKRTTETPQELNGTATNGKEARIKEQLREILNSWLDDESDAVEDKVEHNRKERPEITGRSAPIKENKDREAFKAQLKNDDAANALFNIIDDLGQRLDAFGRQSNQTVQEFEAIKRDLDTLAQEIDAQKKEIDALKQGQELFKKLTGNGEQGNGSSMDMFKWMMLMNNK